MKNHAQYDQGRDNAESIVQRFAHNYTLKGHLRRIISLLSAVVIFATMVGLRFDAQTLERYPMCGYVEHTHDENCKNESGQLTCGLEEHVHTDACYQQRPVKLEPTLLEQFVELNADLPLTTPLPTATAAEDDSPEPVVGEMSYQLGDLDDEDAGDGLDIIYEDAAEERPTTYEYDLNGDMAFLSDVLSAVGAEASNIVSIGEVIDDEVRSEGTHFSVEPVADVEGEYIIRVLADFDSAELGIVEDGDVLNIWLTNGIALLTAIEGVVEEQDSEELFGGEAPEGSTEEKKNAAEMAIVSLDFTNYTATDEHEVYLYDSSLVAVLVHVNELQSADGVAVSEAAAQEGESASDEVLVITGDGTYELNGRLYAVTGLVLPTAAVGSDDITITTANEEAVLYNVQPVFEETTVGYDDIFSLFQNTETDQSLISKISDALLGFAYADAAERTLQMKLFNIALQDVETGAEVEPGTAVHVETSFEGIVGFDFALYHIVDGKPIPVENAVVCDDQGRAVGFDFYVDSLSPFALIYYTVTAPDGEVYIGYSLKTDDRILDAQAILDALGIEAEATDVSCDDAAVSVDGLTITLPEADFIRTTVFIAAGADRYEVTLLTGDALTASAGDYAVTLDLSMSGLDNDTSYRVTIGQAPATEDQLAAVEAALSETTEDGIRKIAHVSNLEMVDISIINIETGEAVEPAGSVAVSLFRGGEAVPNVVHIKGDGSAEVLAVTDGSFVTDSFSFFTGTYTVDFEYNGYTWRFPGFGSYAIADIMTDIGVEGEITDVTLIRVDDQGGDANVLYLNESHDALVSDAAFEDTFELRVTVGGDIHVLTVTDAVQPGNDYTPLEQVAVVPSRINFNQTAASGTGDGYSYDVLRIDVDIYYEIPEGSEKLDKYKELVAAAQAAQNSEDRIVKLDYDLTNFLNSHPEMWGLAGQGELKNNDGVKVGIFDAVDGHILIRLNADLLDTHTTYAEGSFTFHFEVDSTQYSQNGQNEYVFPGTNDTLTIDWPGNAHGNGTKTVDKTGHDVVYAAEDGNEYLEYNYTLTIDGGLGLNELKLTDYLPEGMTLKDDTVNIKRDWKTITQTSTRNVYDNGSFGVWGQWTDGSPVNNTTTATASPSSVNGTMTIDVLGALGLSAADTVTEPVENDNHTTRTRTITNSTYTVTYTGLVQKSTVLNAEAQTLELVNEAKWNKETKPIDGGKATVYIDKGQMTPGEKHIDGLNDGDDTMYVALSDYVNIGGVDYAVVSYTIKLIEPIDASSAVLTDVLSPYQKLYNANSAKLLINDVQQGTVTLTAENPNQNGNGGTITFNLTNALAALSPAQTFKKNTWYTLKYDTLVAVSDFGKENPITNYTDWTINGIPVDGQDKTVKIEKLPYDQGDKHDRLQNNHVTGNGPWEIPWEITTQQHQSATEVTVTDWYSDDQMLDKNSFSIWIGGTEYSTAVYTDIPNYITDNTESHTFTIDFDGVLKYVLNDNSNPAFKANTKYKVTYKTKTTRYDLPATVDHEKSINTSQWTFDGTSDNPVEDEVVLIKDEYAPAEKYVKSEEGTGSGLWTKNETAWVEYNTINAQDQKIDLSYKLVLSEPMDGITKALLTDTYSDLETIDVGSMKLTLDGTEYSVPASLVSNDTSNHKFTVDIVAVMRSVLNDPDYTLQKDRQYVLSYDTSIPLSDTIKDLLKTKEGDVIKGFTVTNQHAWLFDGPNGEQDFPGEPVEYTFKEKPYNGGSKTVSVWNVNTGAWMETSGNAVRYVDSKDNQLFYEIRLTEERNANHVVLTDTYTNQTLDMNTFTVTFMNGETEVTLQIPAASINNTVSGNGGSFTFDLAQFLTSNGYSFTSGVEYSIKYQATPLASSIGDETQSGEVITNTAQWGFDDGGTGDGGHTDEHLKLPEYVPGTKSVRVRECVKEKAGNIGNSDWYYWYNNENNPYNVAHIDPNYTVHTVMGEGDYHLDYTITVNEPLAIESAVLTDTFRGSADQTLDMDSFMLRIGGTGNWLTIPQTFITKANDGSRDTGFTLNLTDFLSSLGRQFQKNTNYEIAFTTTTTTKGNVNGNGDGQDNQAVWTFDTDHVLDGGHTEVHIKKVIKVEKTYYNKDNVELGDVDFGERMTYVVTIGEAGDVLNGYEITDKLTTYHHYDADVGLKIYSHYGEQNQTLLQTFTTTNSWDEDSWEYQYNPRTTYYEAMEDVFSVKFPPASYGSITGPITLVYEAIMGTEAQTGIVGEKTIYNTVYNDDVEITTQFDVTTHLVDMHKEALSILDDTLALGWQERDNFRAWWRVLVTPLRGSSLKDLVLRDMYARMSDISIENLRPGEAIGDTGSDSMHIVEETITLVYAEDSINPAPDQPGGHHANDPVDHSLYRIDMSGGSNAYITFVGDIRDPIYVILATKPSSSYNGGNIYMSNTVYLTDAHWQDQCEPSTATKFHEEIGTLSASKTMSSYKVNDDGSAKVNWVITLSTTGTATVQGYRLKDDFLHYSSESLAAAKNDNGTSFVYDAKCSDWIVKANGRTLTMGVDYAHSENWSEIVFKKPIQGPVTVTIPSKIPALPTGTTWAYNKAILTDRDGNPKDVEGDGEIKNYKIDVEKTHTSGTLPTAPDFAEEIEYIVEINEHKRAIPSGDLEVVDVLPAGMEYVEGSYSFHWQTVDQSSADINADSSADQWSALAPEVATVDGHQTLTFDFSGSYGFDLNNRYLLIKYRAKLTADEIERLQNIGTNVTQVYLNDATVTEGRDYKGHDTDEWDYQWNKGLDKQDYTDGYFGDESHNPYLYYRIVINEDGRKLNSGHDLVLTDRIETSMELLLPSVKVYEYNGDTRTDVTDNEAIRISYDGITRVLTVRVPDQKKYVLEFTTAIENAYQGMAATFTNTAYLNGESVWSDTVTDEHTVQTMAGTFNYRVEDGFVIRKVDGNNITQTLAGAEFTLYKATFPAMNSLDSVYSQYANYDNDKDTEDYDLTPFVLSGQDPNFTPVVKVTPANGEVRFEHLQMNTLYYWVETKTPGDDYSAGLFAKPQYLILFHEDTPNSQSHAKLLDHLLSDANNIIVNTAKQSYVWTATNVKHTQYTVKKLWQDNNDAAQKRPVSIYVQLYQDGVAYDDSSTQVNEGLVEIEPNSVGDWEYTWYDLPATKDGGGDHEYTAEELTPAKMLEAELITEAEEAALTEQLKDYVTLYDEITGGIQITNRMKDETTLLVHKAWEDSDNISSLRPAYIDVDLWRETLTGEDVGTKVRVAPKSATDNTIEVADKSIRIYASNNWKAEFTGLILEDGNTTYKYYLVEKPVEGYATNYEETYEATLTGGTVGAGIAKDGIINITNKLDIVKATKRWLDMSGNETWTADVRFKLVKILSTGEFDKDIPVPKYYQDNTEAQWNQTITTTSANRSAIWTHLDPLGEGESYFAIEDGIIINDEEVQNIQRNEQGAAMSFELNGVTYDVTGGQSTNGLGVIINAPRVSETFTKTWTNVENPENLSIQIQLKRKDRSTGQYDTAFNTDAENHPEGQPITLTAAKSGSVYDALSKSETAGTAATGNTWTYGWANLPLTEWLGQNGGAVEYDYEVEELGVFDGNQNITNQYFQVYSHDRLSVNNAYKTQDIPVSKTWSPEPDTAEWSITANLQYRERRFTDDGVVIAENQRGDWSPFAPYKENGSAKTVIIDQTTPKNPVTGKRTVTITLPKYRLDEDTGDLYELRFTATEVAYAGYQTTVNVDSETGEISIVNEKPSTDIEVQKVWAGEITTGQSTVVLYQVTGVKDLEAGQTDPAMPSDKINVTVNAKLSNAATSAASIVVAYTGTASGSYTLNNLNGWSHTFSFDRGGEYSFTYTPDGQKITKLDIVESTGITTSTTVNLNATAVPVESYTYSFSSDVQPTKGSIDVTCNGVTKRANASNNWNVDFTVAEDTAVSYSAAVDGSFITNVTLDPASTGAAASGNVTVTMHPTVAPLTMDVPVSVTWNATPDTGTTVTVTFTADGETTQTATLTSGNWSTTQTLNRLDDSGSLITWNVAASVTGADNATISDAPSTISGSGSVALTGEIDRKMTLTVLATAYTNYSGLFVASSVSSDGEVSYKEANQIYTSANGTLNDSNSETEFSNLEVKENGENLYYVIRLYDTDLLVETNSDEAGYTTNGYESDTNTHYRKVVWFKAMPGNVTIRFTKQKSWEIVPNYNFGTRGLMSTQPRSFISRSVRGLSNNQTPSTLKTFYDANVDGATGDLTFTAVKYKDLPDGATVVNLDGVTATRTLTNNGSCKWEGLPTIDDDGNPIYYYVVEKDATAKADTMTVSYSYTYHADGTIEKVTITNTTEGIPDSDKKEVDITKKWIGITGNDWPKRDSNTYIPITLTLTRRIGELTDPRFNFSFPVTPETQNTALDDIDTPNVSPSRDITGVTVNVTGNATDGYVVSVTGLDKQGEVAYIDSGNGAHIATDDDNPNKIGSESGEWTYYLQEQPLQGYQPPRYYQQGSADKRQGDYAYADDTIVNEISTYSMPSTGSVGTGIFYGVGLSMMLLACLGFILKSRKRD